MLTTRVMAGLLVATAVSAPAQGFEWLDRMLGIDLDGSQATSAAYQPVTASYAQPYTAFQVPTPLPSGTAPMVQGQAVAPLPQAAPINPYTQPYYQASSGNWFTDCVRDCCDQFKEGCRRFCECICPPRAETATVAPLVYQPQPSQPVVPVPLTPAPIAPVPNPYAQAQPPMVPYAPPVPPQTIAPAVPVDPSCAAPDPSCAAAPMAEASCEATCMAPVAAAAPQPVVYQVPVYAAPPPTKSFCQRLCECFCPPRAAAPTTTYYAAFPQAQPMMQPVLQPVMQAPAMQMPQAACPAGQTGPYEGQITNVQWSDGVVVPGESSGIQLQETPGGDTSTEPPMLPPAPVPPAGA